MVATIKDLDFSGKRVLVRVDYNVPINDDGSIGDDTRIKASLPTIEKLFEKGAKQLVLMTHIGRPEGQVVEKLKTDEVAKRLGELTDKEVIKVDDCIDIKLPENAPLIMLENLRFHNEEEANDETFAEKLSKNGEVYVNDAFGTAHRAHASTAGVAAHLKGCIGLLIEKEFKYLDVEHFQHPTVAILGGAKLHTKLPIIQRILPKVDKILLGGAMIFTFYKAQGKQVGKSLIDEEDLTMAQMLADNEKILLPTDIIVAPNPEEGNLAKTVPVDGIPADQMGLDIGPESIEAFKRALTGAKTVIWNGPLGYFEKEPFNKATQDIAEHLATLHENGTNTIVGGGDSIKAVMNMGLVNAFTHVSTGGGASMKLMEGKKLPAIEALEK